MPQNPLDVAMTAMNNPNALEILDRIRCLFEKDTNPPATAVAKSTSNTDLGFNLPRSSELKSHGVDTQDRRLIRIASQQHTERLNSAINAWIKWISYTCVEYPTLSLIKAIEKNWEV